MKPVLTADEYRRVDKAYEGDLMRAMDRAGYAVALAATRAGAGYGTRVVVLAGPGNNGGDGYVAARYLKARGVDVEIQSLALPKTPEAVDAATKARAVGVRITELADPDHPDVVIDALFGGGVRAGLPDSVTTWMNIEAPIIAVDYPTGLDPDTGIVEDRAFRAIETVDFRHSEDGSRSKDGPDYCGNVTVADIGIDGGRPCMFVAEESDAIRPSRHRTTHKWSAGAVLVVGGSSGMLGASVFAGRSALNFGAGSVVVASPKADLVHEIAPQLPAFGLEAAESRLDRFDVVIAGPGLVEDDADAMVSILKKAQNIVLDAGGLLPHLLDAATEGGSEVVITPHAAEFKRRGRDRWWRLLRARLCQEERITVLLKGNPTLITNGGSPVLVRSGGPELASIGTGDVLAGMIGALWSRGLDGTAAAVSGAYWHGVAAHDLSGRRTVTADVLSEHISAFSW